MGGDGNVVGVASKIPVYRVSLTIPSISLVMAAGLELFFCVAL